MGRLIRESAGSSTRNSQHWRTVRGSGELGCGQVERSRTTDILLATFAALACPVAAAAKAHRTTMVCVNPASGATWELRIDFDHDTVDANPAQVTDASIAWRDIKNGGNYTLD